MGVNYSIDCRHCGQHSDYNTYTDARTMRCADIDTLMHVDTEFAIRCPVCRSKLNTTEADFRAQVRVVRQA